MDGVNVYYNQMHRKWAINHSEGVEFYKNKHQAVSRARTIAKNNEESLNLHEEQEVEETDYSKS